MEQGQPIAIISQSCRLPGGACTPSKLWQLLRKPRDLARQIPQDRFSSKGFYHANSEHHGTTNVRQSYFIDEDFKLFDANFFGINPREAEAIDPLHRILLETVYEALESGGLSIPTLRGSKTSVFVGQMTADFWDTQIRDVESIPQYLATGAARSILSNRVSYFFDWKGPSMTIDTACSSSLVALHQAVQSLRNGESDTAVVAGVNLLLGPEYYIVESNLHMLSPTGRSKMWDASADGYARGEGFVVLVLRRLPDALGKGDAIQCVIRETGVSQDGRTRGITMPNCQAQTELIQSTYRKAGLDPFNEAERCQYFEAHGTGTPVGDPIEAEAIHRAFFENQPVATTQESKPLYVGSIKTVIGHLEGGAGVAGILKVSLAMRNRTIPPNLHFACLSPAIQQFVPALSIPTTPIPWPKVSSGQPLRASVNSFGFGGTNAHAILESFDSGYLPSTGLGLMVHREGSHGRLENGVHSSYQNTPTRAGTLVGAVDQCISPFTFSAASEPSLRRQLALFADYIRNHPELDLPHLAWTLQTRRTPLPVRRAFSALDSIALSNAIEASILAASSPGVSDAVSLFVETAEQRRLQLAIFTGQGAQWPRMGYELLQTCRQFRKTISTLQKSLDSLPDGPQWSLFEEISASASLSRIHKAEISQPICTAVQIALTELLQAAGITFDVTVGHSSGEIAAAYAAGFISAADAIRIAYYRGLHVQLAGQPEKAGSMIAAGITDLEAISLCNDLASVGHLSLAAHNGPSNCTLSGDTVAIEAAERWLTSRKHFVRRLQVDKAYHSYHMQSCSKAYHKSLTDCGIAALPGHPGKIWVSSVAGYASKAFQSGDTISNAYWIENMERTVRFAEAVQSALQLGAYEFAIEIGPHPALKTPFSRMMTAAGKSVPYHGVLNRSVDDRIAFSDLLGFLWQRTHVDFDGYRLATLGSCSKELRMSLELPKYSWDHDKSYWREGRISREFLQRDPFHSLLGTRVPGRTVTQVSWRNIFHMNELKWLHGHQVNSICVLPAAAYCIMAIEACQSLAQNKGIRLIELQDVDISRAIQLKEDKGEEVVFSLTVMTTDEAEECMIAQFSCHSNNVASTSPPRLAATGRVAVQFGSQDTGLLGKCSIAVPSVVPVPVDRFYTSLSKIGLDYSAPFRIESMKRRKNLAVGSASCAVVAPSNEFLVHPAMLDVVFQSTFAAFASPGDGRLDTLYVPQHIRSIQVNPVLAYRIPYEEKIEFKSQITADQLYWRSARGKLSGDIKALTGAEQQVFLQVDGITFTSLTKATLQTDRDLASSEVWHQDFVSNPRINDLGYPDQRESRRIVEACEKLSHYYLQKLALQVSLEEVATFSAPYQKLWAFVQSVLGGERKKGGFSSHRHLQCVQQLEPAILNVLDVYKQNIDIQLCQVVGDNLLGIVRGQIAPVELMLKDDLLYRFYRESIGYPESNQRVASLAQQISHRYSAMKVLEIGAGTGGTTRDVLSTMERFASYDFTDISSGFFHKAQAEFASFSDRMNYRTLNIEVSPQSQGFSSHAYDLVIACNVLHATKDLKETMKNVRSLMKPGGILILLEITGDLLRVPFIMSGLPGWWLPEDDLRKNTHRPTLAKSSWDSILRQTGFGGIDVFAPDFEETPLHTYSVFTTQAVDLCVNKLRRPLQYTEESPKVSRPLIISTGSYDMKQFAQKVGSFLPLAFDMVTSIEHLNLGMDLVEGAGISLDGRSVISLCDLEPPKELGMSRARLASMQQLFSKCRHVLWVTKDRRVGNAWSNMMTGLGRSVTSECPELRMQFLDLEEFSASDPEALVVAEQFFRWANGDDESIRGGTTLWTNEPELVYANGSIEIPRIVPYSDANKRLNALHRPVATKSTTLPRFNAELFWHDGKSKIQEVFESRNPEAKSVEIQVTHSTIMAVQTGTESFHFLCFGTRIDNNQQVVALSQKNRLYIRVPETQLVAVDIVLGSEELLLSMFVSKLIADHFTFGCRKNGNLLIHGASPVLKRLLDENAAGLGLSLLHTKYSPAEQDESQSLRTAEDCNPASLALLHNRIDGVLDVTTHKKSILGRDLRHTHSQKPIKPSDYFRLSSKISGFFNEYHVREKLNLLHQSWKETLGSAAHTNGVFLSDAGESLLVQSIDGKTAPTPTIFHWKKMHELEMQVRPLDPSLLLYPNKTYVLVGMTSTLGQSVCRWMIENGAIHIVLLSRTPVHESPWINELMQNGARIHSYSVDVTKSQPLAASFAEISNSMPPLGGIINGAMVLEDALFCNLTTDAFNKVLQPKVSGSRNLDRIVADTPVDFFLMISSIASVVGSPGQANYSAACMFMKALAIERRQKGLNASVLDLSMVSGLGFFSRKDEGSENHLRRLNCEVISEQELHALISESILMGMMDAHKANPVLVSGLRKSQTCSSAVSGLPKLHENPRFAYFTCDSAALSNGGRRPKGLPEQGQQSKEQHLSPKQQLEAVLSDKTDRASTTELFIGAVLDQLATILHMPVGDVVRSTPLINLGLDSLIAVEMRSWLLEELGIDIPVLRLLDGMSAHALCEEVVELSRASQESS